MQTIEGEVTVLCAYDWCIRESLMQRGSHFVNPPILCVVELFRDGCYVCCVVL